MERAAVLGGPPPPKNLKLTIDRGGGEDCILWNMMKKACSRLLALSAALLAGAAWGETLDVAQFPHRVAIQFSGYASETMLENFPVLVKLAEGQPVGFSYADCAADSFRFTDTDGNVLPHDVEAWDPEGTSLIWVSVPQLSGSSAIFFRYGATAADLPANTPEAVWSRAGYVGVWHMAEERDTVADAAGNNLAATPKGGDADCGAVEGVIGNGRRTATAAARGYLSIPNYDALALGATFTVSAWIRADSVAGYPRIFSRKNSFMDNNGWEVELSNNSTTTFTARAAGNSPTVSGNFPDVTADWRLVTLAYDGKTLEVFGDGARVAWGTVSSVSPDNGLPLSFGCDADGTEAFFRGAFDEARLRRGASSAEWVAAEYANIRTSGFAVYSPVDGEVQNLVLARAGTGGTVQIDGGAADSTAASAGVALGTSLTATVAARPADGYRFFRWSGDTFLITSGDAYSPTVEVTTTFGAALTAQFVSKADGGCIEVVNAFDHPSGGFTSASYKAVPGRVFSNLTDCVIAFTAPDDAPAGLRAFYHAEPATTGFTDDWGYFTAFAAAQSATTETGIDCTAGGRTGLGDKGVVTYAGSWYVPEAGTYSFRMGMAGMGQLVLDNRLILQQRTAGTAVATNGIALAQGWHNLYAVFPARSGAVGPADATVDGLLYSAVDADLAADPAQGRAFAMEEGDAAHRLSTAFNGVFVPSLWAEGGDVLLDCANALGDVRIAGQWGSLRHTFAIRNLPEGHALEVGRPIAASTSGYQNLDDFAWIDWTRTTLPPGVDVRFEGAVAVAAPLPAGHAWSFGRRVSLATAVADFFGVVAAGETEFHFPDGLVFLQLGTPSVLGDTVKIHVAAGQGLDYAGGVYYLSNSRSLPFRFGGTASTFQNEVEVVEGGYLSATAPWDSSSVWSGDVLGWGGVGLWGWGRRMTLTGVLNAGRVTVGQLGNRVNLCPRAGAGASQIGDLYLSNEQSDPKYAPPTFFYCPAVAGEPPLSVDTVDARGANWLQDRTQQHRCGSTLSTCSNNTVNVSSLRGSGLHLRTVVPGGTVEDPAEIDRGFGNFTFGAIDAAMTLYVSSNVNITVTNVNKATAFRYEVNSNGVNDAVLDIPGTCAPSTLRATDAAMLPARITGFVGEVALTETAAKTYPITLDFAKDAPNHGGCDGAGTLVAAPSSGAVEVTLTGGEPKAGDYGLVRFTSGGDLLANWTVTVPTFYQRHSVKVMKDDTGLWLKIRKGGMVLVVR